MTNSHVSNEDWDQEEMAKQQQSQANETIRFVARLSDDWQKEHEVKTKKVEEQLLQQYRQASADETVLLHIAAHDAVLSSLLAESETQVAKRLRVMIDNAAVGLALARTLRQVVACRTAATDRIQQVLQTVGVLRGQRRVRESATLRRVA
jgi:hypothetical protein